MTYEEFKDNLHRTEMYETVYTDSEGNLILVIRMLDAYAFMSPSPREWMGLTDDEVSKIISKVIGFNSCVGWEEEFARAIETKLKEKNT